MTGQYHLPILEILRLLRKSCTFCFHSVMWTWSWNSTYNEDIKVGFTIKVSAELQMAV